MKLIWEMNPKLTKTKMNVAFSFGFGNLGKTEIECETFGGKG